MFRRVAGGAAFVMRLDTAPHEIRRVADRAAFRNPPLALLTRLHRRFNGRLLSLTLLETEPSIRRPLQQ
jgi:hypothetical protein